MRVTTLSIAGGVVLLAATAAQTTSQRTQVTAHRAAAGDPATLTVVVRDVDGDRVGTVRLSEEGRQVRVSARLRSLAPGFHGFHVHETGSCDPAAPGGAFRSAGDHYAGGDPDHGDHAGDLPSLLAGADGRARLDVVTDRFTLAELQDDNGSAVVVHAERDNFANIPARYSYGDGSGPDAETGRTGDAGGRVACGVVSAERSGRRSVPLRDADGRTVGTVVFEQRAAFVEVTARVRSVPEGSHGFHVHSVGACDPEAPDGVFMSAKGHHVGDRGAHGEHDGDLPSLLAMSNDRASLGFRTDAFTLAELRDRDGSAVVVHERRDNFANVPDDRYTSSTGEEVPDDTTRATGDAGGRLACGVVYPSTLP